MIRWDGLLRRATGRSGTVNGKRGQKAAQLTLLTWLNNTPPCHFYDILLKDASTANCWAVIWWERFCHIYQLCAHLCAPLCPKWPSSCDSHLLFLRADKKPPLGKGSRSSGQGWCSKSLKWFFSNSFQDFLKPWAKPMLKVSREQTTSSTRLFETLNPAELL